MTRIPVTSTELRSVGYDAEQKLLEIEFNNGGLYHYFAVDSDDYMNLMAALSKGRFFNERIRNRHECIRVG